MPSSSTKVTSSTIAVEDVLGILSGSQPGYAPGANLRRTGMPSAHAKETQRFKALAYDKLNITPPNLHPCRPPFLTCKYSEQAPTWNHEPV
eukprot:10500486-Karenia_brevis.AAC.1